MVRSPLSRPGPSSSSLTADTGPSLPARNLPGVLGPAPPGQGSELSLDQQDITIIPDDPVAGDAIGISALVAETMDIETQKLEASLEVQDADGQVVHEDNLQASEQIQDDTYTFEFAEWTEKVDAGDYSLGITVDAHNANEVSQSMDLTVDAAPDPAYFEIAAFDAVEIEQGETADITVQVENTGEKSGEQDIQLTVIVPDDDDIQLTEEDLLLDAGETEAVSFEDVDTSALEAGTYTVEIETEDDVATTDLTVAEPEESQLQINAITVEPEEPEANQEFSVDVELEETENVLTENLLVALRVEGTEILETVEVNGELSELQGNSATVTFDGLTADTDGVYIEVGAKADNADSVTQTAVLNTEFTMSQALDNWAWLQDLEQSYNITGVGDDLDPDALRVIQAEHWEKVLEGASQVADTVPDHYSLLDTASNILSTDLDLSKAEEIALSNSWIDASSAEELLELENFDETYQVSDEFSALIEASSEVREKAGLFYLTDTEQDLGTLTDTEAETASMAINSYDYEWRELSLFGGDRDMMLIDQAPFTGTEADEVLVSVPGESNVLDASAGGDNILLSLGAGQVEAMVGGPGEDDFVVLGDLTVGGKVDSAETTALLGRNVSELNGRNFSENADGEDIIIQGHEDSEDTLHLFGDVDTSDFEISNVEHLRIYSDITLTLENLEQFQTVSGDGRSIIRLSAEEPKEFSISPELSGIGQVDIGANVTLIVDDDADLGGARVLTGSGTLQADKDVFGDMGEYSITNELNLHEDGSQAEAAHRLDTISRGNTGVDEQGYNVLEGTTGDDYLTATAGNDVLDGLAGDDILAGRDGNDIYRISDEGKKVIIHTDGQATLDLSKINEHGAEVSLENNQGGTIGNGWADVQFGFGTDASGVAGQEGEDINVLLIMDTSGSMGGNVTIDGETKTRMEFAKPALQNMFDIYDNIGSPAVRIVEFDSSANSWFYGEDGWEDRWYEIDDARDVVDGLTAGGGTSFDRGLEKGMGVFETGRGDIFNSNSPNVAYFVADGMPSRSGGIDEDLQNEWQSFLEEHEMISRSIGVGIKNDSAYNEMKPAAYDGRTGEPIDPIHDVEFEDFLEELQSQAHQDVSFVDNLFGTQQDDILTGNNLDNHIWGVDGDNAIHVRGGNDFVVGGPGEDTALFRKDFSQYEVTPVVEDGERIPEVQDGLKLQKGDVLVKDLGDPDAEDWDGEINVLRYIDNIQFADQTIDLDPEQEIPDPEDDISEDVWSFPSKIDVEIVNIETGGQLGRDGVTVEANVSYYGGHNQINPLNDNVFLHWSLGQDNSQVNGGYPVRMNYGDELNVKWEFDQDDIEDNFNPGAIEAEFRAVEHGFETIKPSASAESSDEQLFGLYLFQDPRDVHWWERDTWPWFRPDIEWQFQWADSAQSPFDMIGLVPSTWRTKINEDGYQEKEGAGTGFLITPQHVMTNAHVVGGSFDHYNPNTWQANLSELESVEFHLGRNGDKGTADDYSVEKVYLQTQNWGKNFPSKDMAILRLDDEVHESGYFDWFWNDGETEGRDVKDETVAISGYNQENIDQGKDHFFQWTDSGKIERYLSNGEALRYKNIESGGGHSGSPVFREKEDGFEFVGVNASSNKAANLDPDAYDWALSVVQSDGYLMDMDLIDEDKWGENPEQHWGPHKSFLEEPVYSDDYHVADASNLGLIGINEDSEGSVGEVA